MSDLTSRAQGNEVVSATLIEIMLVLVFVLLIVLVGEQRGSEDDKASLERLCPEFRQAVETMNFRNLAEQIDCKLVKSDPGAALQSWLEVLGKIIKAGGLVIDVNPPGEGNGPDVFTRINLLQQENQELKETNARIEQELEKLRRAYEELKRKYKELSGGQLDLEDALREVVRLTEQLSEYKELLANAEETIEVLQGRLTEALEKIKQQNIKIAKLEAKLGPGDGGTAPGVCMGTLRADGSLSPDYLVRVDYTGERPIVSLRSDGRHSEEIDELTRLGFIPSRLQAGVSAEYSAETFRIDFAPLYAYSLGREPACRYQALLFLNEDEVSRVNEDKQDLISGFFFLDTGFR